MPIIRLLPPFIISKFVKTDSIQKDIEIDLRSLSPVNFNLNSTIPEFTLWLRLTNKSVIPIVIDRILIDVWIGQPVIDGAILRPVTLLPKQTLNDLRFQVKLSEFQKNESIKYREQRYNANITINMVAYCECKLGKFELVSSKEFRDN